MPLYQVVRRLGSISPEEIDAAAFRAVACMAAFSDMNWLRSYFDPISTNLFCLYEAANPDDIRKHAELARIPCDEVSEVVEYLPDRYR